MKCKLLVSLKSKNRKTATFKTTNQVTEFVKTFHRCDQTEEKFMRLINLWFENNNNIEQAECEFFLHTGYTALGCRSFLDSVTVKCKLSKDETKRGYAVAMIERFGSGGVIDFLQQWQEENPHFIVVNTVDGIHSQTIPICNSSGKHESFQIYVFYEFDRSSKKAKLLV